MADHLTSKILVVAAEASSELYGRRIMEEVKRRNLPISFFGIGSEGMKRLGFDAVESSENMAVVGLVEVLAHFKLISRAFRTLVARAKKERPPVALLLDYPDFNLRLAKRLKNINIPVIYFISPQVWAWRTGRVHLIRQIVAKMLVVFPFEKEFYEYFEVPVEFVGHPLLDEINHNFLDETARAVGREHLGVGKTEFLVGLLPGSRESELKYNFRSMLDGALIIAKEKPHTRFLILVAPTLEVSRIKELIPDGLSVSFRIVKDEPLKVMQLCDACMVASGTATLMTGLAETPMVIMYKMNKITGVIAKRLVRGRFFGMANLILGEPVVPELFQDEASPQNLAREIIKYLDDPGYLRVTKEKLKTLKTKLGSGGAVSRVVDQLQAMLK